MTDTCVVCAGRAELVRGFREVRAGDRTVTVEGEFMQCVECGERFYRAGQMREFQRAAAELVRREEGLLAPSDILGFRERYSLSQAALEHLINAGPKTVGRWERGTVSPSGPADTLLRELIDSPALVRKVAARRGIALGENGPGHCREGTRACDSPVSR
ncbi:MAG TPA: type II TA system antitoxin MqsA family protein [Longimicrobium sp.]|nr:type II TA system antitoxin MqsA family protein [Longimicrobium sp.]